MSYEEIQNQLKEKLLQPDVLNSLVLEYTGGTPDLELTGMLKSIISRISFTNNVIRLSDDKEFSARSYYGIRYDDYEYHTHEAKSFSGVFKVIVSYFISTGDIDLEDLKSKLDGSESFGICSHDEYYNSDMYKNHKAIYDRRHSYFIYATNTRWLSGDKLAKILRDILSYYKDIDISKIEFLYI